ncbi:MAG: TonB family protein [Pseudomonadota bacterium]
MIRVFVIAVVCLTLARVSAAQERIALVIGNGAYDHMNYLANPVNDAKLIRDALSDVGFDVHVEYNATEDMMYAAFKAHGERLEGGGADAIGFVFFAGHGLQVDGLNFLLPVDAEVYSTADVYGEAPRLADLFKQLERGGNATNFVVLDACRNNNLTSSYRGGGGLARETSSRGTLIAYATQPGAVAADGSGSNSPYSEALAAMIGQPGLAAESMFRRVATQVEIVTNDVQQPWTESGLRGEDFCFAGCNGSAQPFSFNVPASSGGGASRDAAEPATPAFSIGAVPEQNYRNATEAFIAQRFSESATLYEAACSGGVMEACHDLAHSYENGYGVPKDIGRAQVFFSRACDGNLAQSCSILGLLYHTGQIDEPGGEPAMLQKAKTYYDRGCQGGDALGCDKAREIDTPDRDARPITPPQALYPSRAAEREIEGSCEVSLNVDSQGNPVDVTAECTDNVFTREAERALSRAKFAPKFVNGVAVERIGVVYPLEFSLSQ